MSVGKWPVPAIISKFYQYRQNTTPNSLIFTLWKYFPKLKNVFRVGFELLKGSGAHVLAGRDTCELLHPSTLLLSDERDPCTFLPCSISALTNLIEVSVANNTWII